MILLDYFGVFGWISGKMDEISKIWAISGVLRCGVGIPRSSVGPHRGLAKRGLVQASGMPQRSSAMPLRNYYSQYGNFCVLFCFVFPFLQGLVHWTNEDPISV